MCHARLLLSTPTTSTTVVVRGGKRECHQPSGLSYRSRLAGGRVRQRRQLRFRKHVVFPPRSRSGPWVRGHKPGDRIAGIRLFRVRGKDFCVRRQETDRHLPNTYPFLHRGVSVEQRGRIKHEGARHRPFYAVLGWMQAYLSMTATLFGHSPRRSLEDPRPCILGSPHTTTKTAADDAKWQ